MIGISLAALLGAAAWFGPRIIAEDHDSAVAPADSAPTPETIEETDAQENESAWPSGPMFQ